MKYHLDSMLPIRAFSPRSGRARGFAAGGMTLESDGGGSSYWQDTPTEPAPAPEAQGTVTVTGAPEQGGGGGGVDQGTLNQLYEQYLGRGVDPSGAATWAGQDINSIIAGITGSQEYANRGGGNVEGAIPSGPSGIVSPAGNLPGYNAENPAPQTATPESFVNQLYQDVLGRAPDTGAQNWINAIASGQMTAQDVARSIATSQEAQQNARPNTDEQRIADAIAAGYGGTAISPEDRTSQAIQNDPYLKNLTIDPAEAQTLLDLKNTNPTQYYSEVAQRLKDQAFEGYRTNDNFQGAYNQLQSLKTVDPQSYYKNQLDFLAKQVGWQEGQNTSERAKPVIEEIKKIAAEAQAAGIKPDEIKSIVTNSSAAANLQNQQRIAQEAESGGSGFSFSKDVLPGLEFIGAGTLAMLTADPELALLTMPSSTAAVGSVASTTPAWLTAAGQGALTGGAMGGINAALSGGNIGQGIIRGGLTGGVGGGVGGALGNTALGSIAGGAGAGALGAKLAGTNIGQGALYGGLGGAVNAGLRSYGANLPTWMQNPIISNAITGGALSSAMGGNFLKGAESGAITGAISPYVSNAYNTYFGGGGQNYNTPTGAPSAGSIYVGQGGYNPYEGSAFTPAEIAAGVGTPATSGTPAGFAFTPQEIAAGVGTPQTSGISPNDMKAALAVTPSVTPASVEQATYEAAKAQGKTEQEAVQAARQSSGAAVPTTRPETATPFSKDAEVISTKTLPNGVTTTDYSNGAASFKMPDGTVENYNAAGVRVGEDGKPLTKPSNELYKGSEVKVALPGTAAIESPPGSTEAMPKYTSLLQVGGDPNRIAPIGSSQPVFQVGGEGALGGGAAPNLQENRYVPWAGSSSEYGKYDIQASSRTGTGDVYSVVNFAGEGGPQAIKNPDDSLQIVIKTAEEAGFTKPDPQKIDETLSKLTPEQKQGLEKQLPVTKEAKPVEKTPEEKKVEEQKKTESGAAEGEKVDEKKPGGGGGNGVKVPLDSLKPNEARIESVDKEKGTAVVVNKEGNISKVSISGDPAIGSKVSVQDLSTTSQQLAQPLGGAQVGAKAANAVENPDGSKTYTYDDGSTLKVDKDGKPIGGTDSDGNPISMPSEKGTTNIPGTGPGEEGGTGGGIGTGNGPGEGPGEGPCEGAGGGGGGGGGACGGAGAGTGTTSGKGGPSGGMPKPVIKYPTIDQKRSFTPSGIADLTPGFTKGSSDYVLPGEQFHFASGGSTSGLGFGNAFTPYNAASGFLDDTIFSKMKPATTKGSSQYKLAGYATGGLANTQTASMSNQFLDNSALNQLKPGMTKGDESYKLPGYATGGDVEEHNPQFFSEGGLNSLKNRYVKGPGDGTSDSVPAMLANGEFVIPADVVSSLGNGSNDSGAHLLDEFLKTIRDHKRRADAKHLPPDSKGPLAYLLAANKKVKKR